MTDQDFSANGSQDRITKEEIVTRDELFEMSVRFGLGIKEIGFFSQYWKYPLTTQQQISKKITAMNLHRAYAKMSKKRVSYHDNVINRAFVHISGLALKMGLAISNVSRETKRFDESAVRPDFAVDIDGRTICCEVQASKTTYTLWSKKLRQYVKLYEEIGDQFSVLILVHSKDELRRAREGARRAMSEHPTKHRLLLFQTIDAFWEIGIKDREIYSCFKADRKFSLC